MPRTTKMTTARLGLHHVRWLRDLAAAEGDEALMQTCDTAGASPGQRTLREIQAAQRTVVDEINRRTGYDRSPTARAAQAARARAEQARSTRAQLEREVEDYLGKSSR